MLQVHKDAEMASAEPSSVQTGKQAGKTLVDIQYFSPPLQVDGRFMVGGFCVEDVPGIHSPPAAVCQELDLFRMIIIPQNPVDYTCQLFPVNRFEQVVKRPGVKAVENIVPISGYKDNGAVRTCAAREMPFSFSSSMSSRRR